MDFSADGVALKSFEAAAKQVNVPLALVHLPQETQARKIWERDAVLVRPDGYVAWRSKADIRTLWLDISQKPLFLQQ